MAVKKTVCPESRFDSPRNPPGPWRLISAPVWSRTAASPSTIAISGYRRSPTRKSTSPTFARRSSPCSASVASCPSESTAVRAANARTLFPRGCRFRPVEQSGLVPVLDPAVIEFIHGGVAVGVATRDEELRPEFARGWGPGVSPDGRSVTLCVSAPEGSRMRANLEGNGAVAVGFCPPTVARAVQLKGVALVVGEPQPDDLER